jgi:hypothetical protein
MAWVRAAFILLIGIQPSNIQITGEKSFLEDAGDSRPDAIALFQVPLRWGCPAQGEVPLGWLQ